MQCISRMGGVLLDVLLGKHPDRAYQFILIENSGSLCKKSPQGIRDYRDILDILCVFHRNDTSLS